MRSELGNAVGHERMKRTRFGEGLALHWGEKKLWQLGEHSDLGGAIPCEKGNRRQPWGSRRVQEVYLSI